MQSLEAHHATLTALIQQVLSAHPDASPPTPEEAHHLFTTAAAHCARTEAADANLRGACTTAIPLVEHLISKIKAVTPDDFPGYLALAPAMRHAVAPVRQALAVAAQTDPTIWLVSTWRHGQGGRASLHRQVGWFVDEASALRFLARTDLWAQGAELAAVARIQPGPYSFAGPSARWYLPEPGRPPAAVVRCDAPSFAADRSNPAPVVTLLEHDRALVVAVGRLLAAGTAAERAAAFGALAKLLEVVPVAEQADIGVRCAAHGLVLEADSAERTLSVRGGGEGRIRRLLWAVRAQLRAVRLAQVDPQAVARIWRATVMPPSREADAMACWWHTDVSLLDSMIARDVDGLPGAAALHVAYRRLRPWPWGAEPAGAHRRRLQVGP